MKIEMDLSLSETLECSWLSFPRIEQTWWQWRDRQGFFLCHMPNRKVACRICMWMPLT